MMNSIRNVALAAASSLLLGACATGPKIQSDYDESVDFSQYRTYGFYNPMTIEGPNYSTIFGEIFRGAIREQMNARGYREVETDPDLRINVSARLQDKVQVTEVPSAYPGYYGYRRGFYDPWYGYGHGSTTHVDQYTEGTVNVDLVDENLKRLVWEGIAIGRVRENQDRDKLRESIRAGVATMFEGYPFRAGQG